MFLQPYAVMAFAGGLAAFIYLYFRSARYHMTSVQLIKGFALCSLTCFLGCKLLDLMVIWGEGYVDWQEIPTLFLESGYVFYGGLFGTLFGIWLFVKKSKDLCLKEMLQLAAPAVPLFHGFGRIGCALAGCCYGVILSPPIVFFNTFTLERFPTQMIEAVFEFALFGVLCFLDKYKKKVNLLEVYLVSYACFRFFLENYRADMNRGIWSGWSTAQWISVGIILFYAISALRARKAGNAILPVEENMQRNKYEGGSSEMFCENCGNQIQSGEKFCSNCGTPVGGEVSAPVLPVNQNTMPSPPDQSWSAPDQQQAAGQQSSAPGDKKKLYYGLGIAAAVLILVIGSFAVYNVFFDDEDAEEMSDVLWATEDDMRAKGMIPRYAVVNKKNALAQNGSGGKEAANPDLVRANITSGRLAVARQMEEKALRKVLLRMQGEWYDDSGAKAVTIIGRRINGCEAIAAYDLAESGEQANAIFRMRENGTEWDVRFSWNSSGKLAESIAVNGSPKLHKKK